MADTFISLNRPIEGIADEIQVLPFGNRETEKGSFTLDEEGAEAIISEFDSRKNDMVIDYEHQTLSGGEAPAAGWIKRLIFRKPENPPSPPFAKGGDKGESLSFIPPLKKGDGGGFKAPGLWAVVEWTPRAVEYLKNREYRYLSPVFIKRVSDNKVVRLINAALTNQPAIDGMVPVVNKNENPPLPPLLKGGTRDSLYFLPL